MGQLLQAIENSAIIEIESGPMLWRIKKICSADLAKVGHAALAMTQVMADGKDDKKASEQDALSQIANARPEQLETMARLKDAIVAAALIGVGNPDSGEWEQVECVVDPKKSDAENGKLWVGSIPTEISDEIFQEAMKLATDGGAAVERLQAFRGRARDSADRRPDSKAVRKAAK